MESLGIKEIRGVVSGIAALMTEKRDELISLDGAMGDGDLGLTMEKGFAAAREEAEKTEEPDLGKYLMKIGMAIARAAPSTMGTLVATGFMSGGKAVMGVSSLGGPQMAVFLGCVCRRRHATRKIETGGEDGRGCAPARRRGLQGTHHRGGRTSRSVPRAREGSSANEIHGRLEGQWPFPPVFAADGGRFEKCGGGFQIQLRPGPWRLRHVAELSIA